MPYAVWTNALHDSPVIPPVLRPLLHVVVRGVMDAAVLPLAFGLGVDKEDTIRSDELIAFHIAQSDLGNNAMVLNWLDVLLPLLKRVFIDLLSEDIVVVVAELLGEIVAWSGAFAVHRC